MDRVRQKTEKFVKDDLVLVKLDDCPDTFSVSKALLLHASEYFVKALDGDFREASDQTLRLPGCDEQTFRLFLYYLAERTIPDYKHIYEARRQSDDDQEEGADWARDAQIELLRLWFFADEHLIRSLQNTAIRRLGGLLEASKITVEAVELAFEAPEGHPLRDLAVREAVFDNHHGEWFLSSDMDHLGAIPGFFSQFTAQMRYCEGRPCKHQPHCIPSQRMDYEAYLVAES